MLNTLWRWEGQYLGLYFNVPMFIILSYDEKVRLFDTRKLSVPVTSVNAGGGIWRLKWHPEPSRKTDLLAACMHDGFKVIRLKEGEGTILSSANGSPGIVQGFSEHESLAYGADWCYSAGEGAGSLVASCSFYDHSLRIWRA